jgi:hypothetical protein
MPTGYTDSPAEFQQCMVFILQNEIPHTANIFIDDLPTFVDQLKDAGVNIAWSS